MCCDCTLELMAISRRLTERLIEAERFEGLYERLLTDYRTLEAREVVALEEVEELTGQNVALMSSGSGDQKITYVENVRRELAMAKQVRDQVPP